MKTSNQIIDLRLMCRGQTPTALKLPHSQANARSLSVD